MKHAQYYRNIANGIARIAQAVKFCDLAGVEQGTIFSERFKIKGFTTTPGFRIKVCKDPKISNEEYARLMGNHLQKLYGNESFN